MQKNLTQQNNNNKNNIEKIDSHSERFDTYIEKFDIQTEKINIFNEHNEKIDIPTHEVPIISDNYQDFSSKIYTNEELDNYTRKINYYTKKRMDYVLKEAYQKNYERYLEEQYLEDSMEAEKQKQRIKKETIILYMIQKIKEMQGGIPATPEQIQKLIKDLETAMDTLKSILNLIANPHFKKLFKTGFKFIKKFNKHLKNNDIILTENDYSDMAEKNIKLISEAKRFHNAYSDANLMESFCVLIDSMFTLNEKMLMIVVNQERTSLHQKFEGLRSKTFEPVPPMEEKIFVKTFSSRKIPPQEFDSENMQRKNS